MGQFSGAEIFHIYENIMDILGQAMSAKAKLCMNEVDRSLPLPPSFRTSHFRCIDEIKKDQVSREPVQHPQQIEVSQPVCILVKRTRPDVAVF